MLSQLVRTAKLAANVKSVALGLSLTLTTVCFGMTVMHWAYFGVTVVEWLMLCQLVLQLMILRQWNHPDLREAW